jgi:hypothetical protein
LELPEDGTINHGYFVAQGIYLSAGLFSQEQEECSVDKQDLTSAIAPVRGHRTNEVTAQAGETGAMLDEYQRVETTLAEGQKSTEAEPPYVPLNYQIPTGVMSNKLPLKNRNRNKFWSYELYSNRAGRSVNVHYCKTVEDFDKAACLFLEDKVVGFDMEWVPCNLVRSNSAR